MSYINEPFLKKVLEKYTKNPEQLNVNSVVNYFKNKKNVRNGKDISDGSKVSQISTFKKVLSKIKDIPKLSELKMPLSMMNQVNTVREEHRNERKNKEISIKSSQIKKIIAGLKSDKFDELYPALLLVSGRKPTDLYTMPIKKGDQPRSIQVKSMISRRDNGCEIEYSVPLLSSFSAFNKGVKKLRALFPEISGMTDTQIAKKYSKTNANAMISLSNTLKTKVISSDMRILYVKVLHSKNSNDITFQDFVKGIINNDPVDVSQNYDKINII